MKQKKISILSLFLLLLLSVVAVITSCIKINKHFKDGVWQINDEKDFIDVILNNNYLKENDEYVLTKEIKIPISHLPKEDINFYGKLNGQGNRLILLADDESNYLAKPIFRSISGEAEISRVDFVLDEKIILGSFIDEKSTDSENFNNYNAVLAQYNSGTITDCSMEIGEVFISNSCNYMAALVNHNYGKVTNICIAIHKIGSAQNKKNWQCAFGAVASYNHANALVQHIIVEVNFENNNQLSIFENGFNNKGVGYILGIIEKESNVDELIIFKYFAFQNKATDINSNENIHINIINKISKDLIKTWRNWELVNENSLPRLKVKGGTNS